MLSWQDSLGNLGGDGKDFIVLLPDDDPITGEGSPQTLRNEKLMESGKRRQGHPRCTDLHAGAGRRIEHPRGYLDDQAGLHHDRGHRAAGTMFDAFKE